MLTKAFQIFSATLELTKLIALNLICAYIFIIQRVLNKSNLLLSFFFFNVFYTYYAIKVLYY